MLELLQDSCPVTGPLDASDESCPDGCGLSSRECEGLHERIVARVRALLKEVSRSAERQFVWPRGA